MKQDRPPIREHAAARKPTLRQVAALPWRRAPDGGIEVLLVTSRGTGRWVVPKGWPMKGLNARDAAAREAYEEAGVRGRIDSKPLGAFQYLKLMESGVARLSRVKLYRLEVTEELAEWPERAERTRRWMSAQEAAAGVDEPGLAALLATLD